MKKIIVIYIFLVQSIYADDCQYNNGMDKTVENLFPTMQEIMAIYDNDVRGLDMEVRKKRFRPNLNPHLDITDTVNIRPNGLNYNGSSTGLNITPDTTGNIKKGIKV